MKKFKGLVFIAAAGLLLTACNGAGSIPFNQEEAMELISEIDTPWTDYSVPASEIVFEEGEESITLAKGSSHDYRIKSISPKDADANSFTWESANPSIASVKKGKVTGVGGGETTIDVSSNGESLATLNVKVNSPLEELVPNLQSLDLGYGETAQLDVSYNPADTTEKGVSYAIEPADFAYATVNSSGLVTALEGADEAFYNAKVVIKSDVNNQIKAEVNLKVSDKVSHVSGIKMLNNDVSRIEVNHELQLGFEIAPANAANKEVVWSSSEPGVATVDANGRVVAGKNAGTTEITVKSVEKPEIKATLDLEVYEVQAASFNVSPIAVALSNLGSTTQQISISYVDGEDKVITPSYTDPQYSSSDNNVVTVSKTGLITMVGEGDAIISVTDGYVGLVQKDILVHCEQINNFTVTGFPTWIGDYGAALFAWAWGGSAGDGAWYPISLSGTTGTFIPPVDIEHFLMVRCAMGTTEPNWKIGDDRVGRIYNKTPDIDVLGSKTFVSPTEEEWVEYTYEEDPAEPETALDYYLVGDFNSWTKDNAYKLTRVESGHYQLASIDLAAGAKLKVFEPENNAYISNGSPWDGCGFSLDTDGNVVIEEAATYAIEFYPNSPYGNPITLVKGGAPVPSVAASYKVKFGATETALVEVAKPAGAPANLMARYEANVTVANGDVFSFLADGVAIKSNIGPNADDLKSNPKVYNNFAYSDEEGTYLVQADKTNALVQLDVYTNGHSFYVEGGTSDAHGKIVVPQFEEGKPYIVGNRDFSSGTAVAGESWNNPKQAFEAIPSNDDVPEGVFAQYKATITFDKGAEFKAVIGLAEGALYWDAAYEEGGALGDGITKEGAGNCVVATAGTYDIYIKCLENNGGWSVYIGKSEQQHTVDPVVPAAAYAVRIGETNTALVSKDLPAGAPADQIGRFEAEIDVAKDDVFSFLADGVAITSGIGPNGDDTDNELYNNFVKVGATYKFQANKTNALVQLNVYESGYSFWIEGGDSPIHEAEKQYYSVKFEADLSVFATWDDLVSKESLYLYGPEGDVAGSWAEVEGNLSSGELTVQVEEGKSISGAVFYLTQATKGLKQSLDIDVEISAGGEYTVNFGDIQWVEDNEVWKMNNISITKKGDAPVPPVPVEDRYFVSLGGVEHELNSIDFDPTEEGNENKDKIYQFNAEAVVAGQEVVFKKNGVAITTNIGFNGDDELHSIFNNYYGTFGDGIYIQNSRNEATLIELTLWKDGGMSVWIAGGANDDHTKAAGEVVPAMTLDKTVVNLVMEGEAATVTASNANGEVKATSGATSVATVSVEGSVITISPVGVGSAEITVKDDVTTLKITANVAAKAEDVDAYAIKVGENTYDLVYDAEAEHTGDYADRVAAYSVEITGVTKDAVVEFSKNGAAYSYFNLGDGNNNIVGNATDGYKVKDTNAGKVTVYLNVWKEDAEHHSWGSFYMTGAEEPDENIITVYFSAAADWGETMNCYAWKGEGEAKNHDWPGVAMTYVKTNEYGQRVFKIEIDTSLYEKMIFNNGNGQQSCDIPLADVANNTGFYVDGASYGTYSYAA